MENTTFPFIPLPEDVQITLYLIRQELKSRKLFRMLEKIGVNECAYEPYLDYPILKSLGMYDQKDETFLVYDRIMDKRSRRLKETKESLTKQAFKAYAELVNEKERLKLVPFG